MSRVEVEMVWRAYRTAWWFSTTIATIAILIVTIAPVANPEWPLMLFAFWVIYVLALRGEISDYLKTRSGYVRFR